MELSQSNQNKLGIQNSISQSHNLQNDLQILCASFADIEAQALELFAQNPAIESFEPVKPYSSHMMLDFIKQPTKENTLEQIPTKLLSAHDQILAKEILQSLCKEGFLQQEEKSFLMAKHGHRLQFVLETLQAHTGLGFENRLFYWRSLLEKDPKHENLVQLINEYKNEFLEGDFSSIIKKTKQDKQEFKKHCLDVLKTLPISPLNFESQDVSHHHIDAKILLSEEKLDIDLVCPLPNFTISKLAHSEIPDVKQFYKQYLKQIELFVTGVKKRQSTFFKVLEKLSLVQRPYFLNQIQDPIPINPVDFAEELNIHPSTLARCLQNKYILCPRGIIKLKNLVKPEDQIDNKMQILEIINQIIQKEPKKSPYSDEQLLQILRAKGAQISRRTVTKYRQKLNIPDARSRVFFK